MVTVGGINQLGGDSQAVFGFADTAFQDKFDIEPLADNTNIFLLIFIGKRRGSGRHPQPFHLGQIVDDFFGQAITEIALIPVGTHILECQHGYG